MYLKIMRLSVLIIIFVTVSINSQTFWSPTGNLSPSGNNWVPAIACNITGTLLAQSHGTGIYRSTNDGEEWDLVFPTGLTVADIFVSPDGKIFAICNNTGAIFIKLSTDDGLTWTDVYSAQHSDNFFFGSGMVFVDNNTAVAAISFTLGPTIGDIGVEVVRSTNGGLNWQLLEISEGWGGVEDMVKLNDGRILLTTSLSGISYSSDNGSTWHFLSSFPVYSTTDIKTNSFGDIFVGRSTAAASAELLFRSTDNGSSWQPLGILGGSSGGEIEALYIDSENRIYVSYTAGDIPLLFYRSTDNGNSWQELMDGLPPSQLVYSLTGNNQDIIFAGMQNSGVYKGADVIPVELTSFTANVFSNNVKLNWATAGEVNNKGFEILRSQRSEFRSQSDWEKIGYIEGQGTTTKHHNYSFVDKNLSAGNYGYRLIQIDLEGTRNESEIINVEINSVPSEYSLKQNYPNPFNPSTTIEFSIPSDGNVSLKIYNVIGEEVREVLNEFKKAGGYKINFNAGNLASGIYYYRIKTDNYSSVRKMILLK
jgi:photosystem II stability/assembly factor-like uncharacterized protein